MLSDTKGGSSGLTGALKRRVIISFYCQGVKFCHYRPLLQPTSSGWPSLLFSSNSLSTFNSSNMILSLSVARGSFLDGGSWPPVKPVVSLVLCCPSLSTEDKTLRPDKERARSRRNVRITGTEVAIMVTVGSRMAHKTSVHPSTASGQHSESRGRVCMVVNKQLKSSEIIR